ncbi:discoidin domain-containing protein [Micromonospora sp. BRA006-A]|nr:discoidin domain-containing protein [Micromonospora sp. BRA006-A]
MGQQLQRQPVAAGGLGSARTISRAVLRWEAAYATGYRIEVSGDGNSWQPVFSTTAGNGASTT